MLPLRKWLKCVCVFSFICGVVVPFILFLVTNTYDILDTDSSPLEVRRDLEGKLYSSHERRPLEVSNPEDVQLQMEELQRIVVSVRNELRELEHERNRLKKEVDQSKSTLFKVRKEVSIARSSLQESKGKLAKSLRESKRAMQYDDQITHNAKSDIVVVKLPEKSAVQPGERLEAVMGEGLAADHCTDQTCFDYSRCPLTNSFSVYLYNQHYPDLFDLKYPQLVDDLVYSLQLKHSLVSDPDSACIFVVIVGPLRAEVNEVRLKQKLESLSHWKGSGSNHVIVDLPYPNEPRTTTLRSLGWGIVAKGRVSSAERKGYNIVLPPITRHGDSSKPFWKSMQPLLPALRKYLVVHEGFLWDYEESQGGEWIGASHLSSWRDAMAANTKDRVLIAVKCNGTISKPGVTNGGAERIGRLGEWGLCGSPAQRAAVLSNATFSLVIESRSGTVGPETYTRLIEGLRYGAIPVILGLKHLPFASAIDWKRAAIILPSSAFGQLHFILRNIAHDSILRFRRQGRFLWDTYFSSPLHILESMVAIVRRRALHPPPAAPQYVSAATLATIPGENHVIPSPEYLYNFTLYSEEFWNSPPGPLYMYPTTPFKPVPVSGSQYAGLSSKQVGNLPQHIIDAGGITGPFFEDYLLGNSPDEQFTIVMLTYERDDVLLAALGRLKDLDHLAKIVVVWNNPHPPPKAMQWPEIGIAVDVRECCDAVSVANDLSITLACWHVLELNYAKAPIVRQSQL